MKIKVTKFTKINQGALHRYDQKFYRRLNDIYIDTISLVRFLDLAAKGNNKGLVEEIPGNIQVPSYGGMASVTRTQKQVFEIFRVAASTGQWEKSLTFAISITEDQISGYIKLILRSKPVMLLTSIKGNDGNVSIPLADLIKIGTGKIVEEKVQSRVTNAIFASPAEYTKYISTLMQYKIPAEIINPYIEMKARRDLIVHAGGVVNDQYVEKTKGIVGAAQLGQKIVVDREYFEECMRGIKRLATSFFRQALKQYGDDADVHKILKTHSIKGKIGV